MNALQPSNLKRGGVSLNASPLAAPADEVIAPRLKYLGHAGFIYQHGGITGVIDPWFRAAFCRSWFPFPNNRFLEDTDVTDCLFDFLYVSHTHEDHLDRELLTRLPNKDDITVLCADFASKHLETELRELGFGNIVLLGHHQSHDLGPKLRATMILDVSFKEDSGLLLEATIGDTGKTHRFLDLNDCNTHMDELPKNVDVLAAQFAGAMWYPACYEYFPDRAKRAHEILDVLEKLTEEKLYRTEARYFLPSAGVPVFLDPTPEGNAIFRFNEFGDGTTIYPQWEAFSARMDFANRYPDVSVLRLFPGDRVRTYLAKDKVEASAETYPNGDGDGVGCRPVSSTWLESTEARLKEYSAMRSDEWGQMWREDVKPVTTEELLKYLKRLHTRNRRMIVETEWKKHLRIGILGKDGQVSHSWRCIIGTEGPLVFENFAESEKEEISVDEEYSFDLCEYLLRQIVDEKEAWEEVLASLRVRLHRRPDVYDTAFMVCMRYGNHTAIPKGYAAQMREQRSASMEMIELPGLPPGVRIQRYCPHQGEDLLGAKVANGVIVCPRHGWKFCAESGKCISGGNNGIKIDKVEW